MPQLIIGLLGLPGAGKTTAAQEFTDRIDYHFEEISTEEAINKQSIQEFPDDSILVIDDINSCSDAKMLQEMSVPVELIYIETPFQKRVNRLIDKQEHELSELQDVVEYLMEQDEQKLDSGLDDLLISEELDIIHFYNTYDSPVSFQVQLSFYVTEILQSHELE